MNFKVTQLDPLGGQLPKRTRPIRKKVTMAPMDPEGLRKNLGGQVLRVFSYLLKKVFGAQEREVENIQLHPF